METTLHSREGLGTLLPGEREAFLALVDRSFGCGPGQSMGKVCPTALDSTNAGHHFVVRREGRIVAAAAALGRTWLSSWGPTQVAVLGCFATDPQWRGRGLSRALQSHMVETLGEEGFEVALLWTDQPGVYRRRGFAACGREIHLQITEAFDPPAEGLTLRWAGVEDGTELDRLYRHHRYRAQRRPSDWRAFLAPGISRVLMALREEEVVAYAALEKGHDFEGYVHDFGGARAAVHRLWAALRDHGARHVLVPAGAEAYLEGGAESLPRRDQFAAYGLKLTAAATRSSLEEWEFAAWGFDSA